MGRGKLDKPAAECWRCALGESPETALQWRLMEHRLFVGADGGESAEASDLSSPAILRDKYGNLAICRLSKGTRGGKGGE